MDAETRRRILREQQRMLNVLHQDNAEGAPKLLSGVDYEEEQRLLDVGEQISVDFKLPPTPMMDLEQLTDQLIDKLIVRLKQEGLVILQLVPETVSDVQTRAKLIQAVADRVEDTGVVPAEAKEGETHVPHGGDSSPSQGASSGSGAPGPGRIPEAGPRIGESGTQL